MLSNNFDIAFNQLYKIIRERENIDSADMMALRALYVNAASKSLHNKRFIICPLCHKLVNLRKFIFGSLHICNAIVLENIIKHRKFIEQFSKDKKGE